MPPLGYRLPHRCSVCRHAAVSEIEDAIRAGEQYNAITKRFDLPRAAVRYHATKALGIRRGTGWRPTPATTAMKGGVGPKPVGIGPIKPPKNRCLTCSHPSRVEIDTAILAGEPYWSLDRQFGISHTALTNHAVNHLGVVRGTRSLPLRCWACLHPDRDKIDWALRSGVPTLALSKALGESNSPLHTHRHLHLDNPEWEAKLTVAALARLAVVEVAS